MGRDVFGSGWLGPTLTRLRNLFLFATVFSVSLIFFSYFNESIIFQRNYGDIGPLNTFAYDAATQERYTITTDGCNITLLHPLDPNIKRFVQKPDSLKPCPNQTTPLLGNNKTHIWIEEDYLKFYNVSKRSSIKCCYRPFFRPLYVKDITSRNIDNRVEYGKCKPFKDIIKAHDEFVYVVCYDDTTRIYQQYFLFAVEKGLPSIDTEDDNATNETLEHFNVVILGIDAVSRLNFYRTMPQTLNFLKEKEAVELVGYNKVGDNTFPNLVPMLLGIRETDLRKTCVPNPKQTYFDNCPFIWEWYKQAGFYTALGEDSSFLGTFNYLKVGFSRAPTNYYIHTFINEAEKNVGNNKDFNSFLCMHNKYFYQVLLDYIEDLLVKLKPSKLFGFFWEVTMSHDHLNYPMAMDHDYLNFFRRLDKQKILDNTFVFLLSDHGIRWGDIRNTKQGRLEERLPFVHVLVPSKFREQYSEAYSNLRINSHRLTTPFNIHATLNDLLDLRNIENKNILLRKQETYWEDRSISLFVPIPSNRTCSLADIDDHWCTCYRGRKILTSSFEAGEAAFHILEEINKLLQEYKMCATLRLSSILDATEMEVGTKEDDEVSWREFMIVIRTDPSGAVFESTIRYDGHKWAIVGTVSRLNLYGEQSRCVDNFHLKLYCYCI